MNVRNILCMGNADHRRMEVKLCFIKNKQTNEKPVNLLKDRWWKI